MVSTLICWEFRDSNFHNEGYLVVNTLIPKLATGQVTFQGHSTWRFSNQGASLAKVMNTCICCNSRDWTFYGKCHLVIETYVPTLTKERHFKTTIREGRSVKRCVCLYSLWAKWHVQWRLFSQGTWTCVRCESRYLNFHSEGWLVVKTLVFMLITDQEALQDQSMWKTHGWDVGAHIHLGPREESSQGHSVKELEWMYLKRF